MYEIPKRELSAEFVKGWEVARRHLQALGQGGLMWLRSTLEQPILEHLAFRLGNQLFFVVVSIDGLMDFEADSSGILKDFAKSANAHCCVLPLQRRGDEFVTCVSGWGLLDFDSRRQIDPPSLVTDEPIIMTDWEVHDCAVVIVWQHLAKQGIESASRHSYLGIDPSIWFEGPRGVEFVVVRAARYPVLDAMPPGDADDIRAACAHLSKIGNFASVSLASADDPFYPDGSHARPLLRGHGLLPRFTGLVPL